MAASPSELEAELRARVDRELKRRESERRNWVPHEPFAKQRAFMGLECKEALYGGAAGGGKSDTLLMDAAQFCHLPGFGALILRRTHSELILKGALMDRSQEWFSNTPVHWNGDEKRWTWPSGATIEFGYFDTWGDRGRYQSAAWNRIYFDELTHFPEDWYRFMFTRIRRVAGFPVASGMRSATNPGHLGHKWVFSRFVDSKKDGRVFVPATFRDNPFIDQTDYEQQLAEAPDITRRQMLGEWVDDGVGRVYPGFEETRNCIDKKPDEGEWSYILAIDFGIINPNAFTVLGWRKHEQTVYVLESYRKKGDPIDVADEVAALERRYKFDRIIGDVGGMGKAFAELMIERFSIPVEAADKHNKNGFIQLLNGDLAKGRILVVRDRCRDLIAEWGALAWAESGQKEAPGPNHAADSCLYGYRAAMAFSERTATPVNRRTREEQIAEDTRRAWEETEREIKAGKREEREEFGYE